MFCLDRMLKKPPIFFDKILTFSFVKQIPTQRLILYYFYSISICYKNYNRTDYNLILLPTQNIVLFTEILVSLSLDNTTNQLNI